MSARISHEKVLLIILLLLVVLGIAAGVGVVRHLADSNAYQRRDDIYPEAVDRTSGALGEQLYADKIINRPRVSMAAAYRTGSFTLKPGLTAYTADDRARDAEIAGKR
ncbi:hypothetical protein DMI69_17840 [Escherichia coli]|nr:hypothetical protein [Escherichia coli]